MLTAIEGWHPAARALVEGIEPDSMFMIPFGFLEPAESWEPSRVTIVGDAAHGMLPDARHGRQPVAQRRGPADRPARPVRPPARSTCSRRVGAYEAADARDRLPDPADDARPRQATSAAAALEEATEEARSRPARERRLGGQGRSWSPGPAAASAGRRRSSAPARARTSSAATCTPGPSQETVELVRAAGGRMDAIAPVDLSTEDGARALGRRGGRAGRRGRRTGQQRLGHPVRRDRRAVLRGLVVHHAQRARHRLPGDAGGLAAPGRARRREHRQHRVDLRLAGRLVHAAERARRGQGRRARADQPPGGRGRPARHPGQRGQPGHDRDAADQPDAARPRGTAASRSSPASRCGKWGQPEDVANAILFLASDESSHVSGANIPVDGGAAVVG